MTGVAGVKKTLTLDGRERIERFTNAIVLWVLPFRCVSFLWRKRREERKRLTKAEGDGREELSL